LVKLQYDVGRRNKRWSY